MALVIIVIKSECFRILTSFIMINWLIKELKINASIEMVAREEQGNQVKKK